MRVYRYVTVSDTGEETWYDSASDAVAAAGSDHCVLEYAYEELWKEFIQHAGHEPEDCER